MADEIVCNVKHSQAWTFLWPHAPAIQSRSYERVGPERVHIFGACRNRLGRLLHSELITIRPILPLGRAAR